MRFVINIYEFFCSNVSVALCSADGAVPEHLLNNADVSTVAQHICCKGVAEGMRIYVTVSSFCTRIAIEDIAESAGS